VERGPLVFVVLGLSVVAVLVSWLVSRAASRRRHRLEGVPVTRSAPLASTAVPFQRSLAMSDIAVAVFAGLWLFVISVIAISAMVALIALVTVGSQT
jgi:hypothetical protein